MEIFHYIVIPYKSKNGGISILPRTLAKTKLSIFINSQRIDILEHEISARKKFHLRCIKSYVDRSKLLLLALRLIQRSWALGISTATVFNKNIGAPGYEVGHAISHLCHLFRLYV